MTGPDVDDDAREFLAELHREHVADIREAMPAWYVNVPLVPDVESWVHRFVAGTAGNLVMTGPAGVGKTSQAWQVLLRAAELGWRDKWRFDYFDDLAAALRPAGDPEWTVEDRSRTGLLVIDDLATSPLTDWQLAQLGRIVHHRWEQQRPIIVSSNQPNLRGLLGDRVSSRLQHGASLVTLRGSDRRRA